MPDFAIEDSLDLASSAAIVGVDEVGRGPLAGPVTAAALLLDRGIDRDLAASIDDGNSSELRHPVDTNILILRPLSCLSAEDFAR